MHVDYACLEELLKMLERAPYPVDAHPLPKPGSDKLEFNELGAAYRRNPRGLERAPDHGRLPRLPCRH